MDSYIQNKENETENLLKLLKEKDKEIERLQLELQKEKDKNFLLNNKLLQLEMKTNQNKINQKISHPVMSTKIPIKKPIPVVKTNKAAKPLITNKPDSIQKPAIKSKNKTEAQLHGLIVKKRLEAFSNNNYNNQEKK